jgi:hypothetical protein
MRNRARKLAFGELFGNKSIGREPGLSKVQYGHGSAIIGDIEGGNKQL